MYQFPGWLGSWETGAITIASGATAKAFGVVPPFMGGPGRQRSVWDFRPNKGLDARIQPGITHIEKIVITNNITSNVAQQLTLMRPLNYSWFTVGAAKNATSAGTAALFDDPGIFSTNYKYDGVISQGTAVVADHALAQNDYIVYQLADGTWESNLVAASGVFSSVTFTTGVGGNSATGAGGGILAGSPCYYFGPVTAASAAFASQLKDPATGKVPLVLTVDAAVTTTSVQAYTAGTGPGGVFSTLHPGDPILIAITSLTAAPTIEIVMGWYAKV